MRQLGLILFTISIFFATNKPYLLLVSFDGFRYDYADLVDTPNFDKIEKNGTKAKSLIPVFPSLTFPNHYSIATGAYAGKHNITANSFYDRKLDKEYSLYDSSTVRDHRFYNSEPIWVTAERQGVKSASYFWVGSEAKIKGFNPTIFKYYDGSVPFQSRIDSVISWFKLSDSKRPQLILLYFSEPDHTGHKYGINIDKISKSVSKMDSLLGYMYAGLEKLEIFSDLNIVITSDHGMSNVSPDRLIIIDEHITYQDNLNVLGSGSHMQFDIVDDKISSNILYNQLQKIPNSQAWNKDNIPKRFNFINNNTGQFLLLANEGWFITSKEKIDNKKFTLGGMHGYDPNLVNMHGIFYAIGPQIKKDFMIDSFTNIHIYPFLCKLLNIDMYVNEKDGPDGDIKVLDRIIIN